MAEFYTFTLRLLEQTGIIFLQGYSQGRQMEETCHLSLNVKLNEDVELRRTAAQTDLLEGLLHVDHLHREELNFRLGLYSDAQ